MTTLQRLWPRSDVRQEQIIVRAAIQFAAALARADQIFDGGEPELAFAMGVQAAIAMADSLPEAREHNLPRCLEFGFSALVEAETRRQPGQPTTELNALIKVVVAAMLEARRRQSQQLKPAAETRTHRASDPAFELDEDRAERILDRFAGIDVETCERSAPTGCRYASSPARRRDKWRADKRGRHL